MNFCGIICEFNPFHNGHKYIIEQAKKETGLDVICLMSGNFVQRGAPSIQNKYERAKNAIKNGACAVLELPTIYACSNAENFAMGAIKIFDALKITHLAFGIEKTNLETLQKIAKLKFENSERFQQAFKNEIQNGINYNTALKRSISRCLDDENVTEILNKPNNILAIEYLTSILKFNSKIKPVAIERCDNGYYSDIEFKEFLSASAIRENLYNGKSIDKFIPQNTRIDTFFNKNNDNALKMLQILQIRMSSPKTLNNIYDYNEGIEYRVIESAKKFKTFDEIKQNIITPRYREVRVNKLLLYPLLNIKSSIIKNSFKAKSVSKLLAIDKNKKDFLKQFNPKKINVLVCNKDYESLNKIQKSVIDIDLKSSEIYQTIMGDTSNIDKKNGTLFV